MPLTELGTGRPRASRDFTTAFNGDMKAKAYRTVLALWSRVNILGIPWWKKPAVWALAKMKTIGMYWRREKQEKKEKLRPLEKPKFLLFLQLPFHLHPRQRLKIGRLGKHIFSSITVENLLWHWDDRVDEKTGMLWRVISYYQIFSVLSIYDIALLHFL